MTEFLTTENSTSSSEDASTLPYRLVCKWLPNLQRRFVSFKTVLCFPGLLVFMFYSKCCERVISSEFCIFSSRENCCNWLDGDECKNKHECSKCHSRCSHCVTDEQTDRPLEPLVETIIRDFKYVKGTCQ